MFAHAVVRVQQGLSSRFFRYWCIAITSIGWALGQPMPAAHAAGVIPAQFIAKQYTEGLGRAPDQAGWQGLVAYFQDHGCTASTLAFIGEGVYTSDEEAALGYDNAARLLTLYRGVLNREPDATGFSAGLATLNGGGAWAEVVNGFFTSPEFVDLSAAICSPGMPTYSFGADGVLDIPTGATGYTGSEAGLQALLDGAGAGTTVTIAQKAAIHLTTPLVIPSGVTLSTEGAPAISQYALMGRLVRDSQFRGGVVVLAGGSALRHVWIDGQQSRLGYGKQDGGVNDAANVVTLGGTGTVVADNYVTATDGGTSIYSAGADNGYPCASETISGNLVTSYPSLAQTRSSDGLTMKCEQTDVFGNQIVDATDAGIVVFGSPGVPQRTQVHDNTILAAGNSGTEGLGADPQTGTEAGQLLDYSQTVFTNNTIWSGPDAYFILGITSGARAFFPPPLADGTGATFTKNTSGSLALNVRTGIAIDGMLNTTITDNTIAITILPPEAFNGLGGDCPGVPVAAEVSAGHASGTFPTPDVDTDFDNCI